MEENKEQNGQPQQDAATAEQSSKQGRTFTQDDVNQIVSERLARERARHEESPQDRREKELSDRENRLFCREYILEEKLPSELLDVFPTSDVEAFKESVTKLKQLFPNIGTQYTGMTFCTGARHGSGVGDDGIAQAFRKERF